MWTAIAQTVEDGGFGTAGVETAVDVKWSRGSRSRETVLAFANGGPDIGLKMRWDGPSHLVVAYRGSPELLYFQVVKTSGIEAEHGGALGGVGSRQKMELGRAGKRVL